MKLNNSIIINLASNLVKSFVGAIQTISYVCCKISLIIYRLNYSTFSFNYYYYILFEEKKISKPFTILKVNLINRDQSRTSLSLPFPHEHMYFCRGGSDSEPAYTSDEMTWGGFRMCVCAQLNVE